MCNAFPYEYFNVKCSKLDFSFALWVNTMLHNVELNEATKTLLEN